MDDVQHLLGQSKEESYLLVVDSRMRDTSVWPTPSHYEISFSSPFRNVFGMDMLDATVARTEYIVETNSNVLEYALGHPADLAAWGQGAWSAGRKRTVVLQPGDYNLPQFVEHLNDRLAAVAAAANEPAVRCTAATNPSEISNKVVLAASVPFALLMAASTLRHTLGFGDPVTSAASPDYACVPGWSVNRTAGASDTFLSLPAASLPDTDPASATLGPVPSGGPGGVQAVGDGHVVRQYFTSAATGPASQVLAYATVLDGVNGGSVSVSVRRASDDAVMGSGLLAVSPQDASAYAPLATDLQDGGRGPLMEGVQYYVQLSANGAAVVGVYYNEDNLPSTGSRYIAVDGVLAHAGENLCVDVIAASWGHAVRSPGLVNLSGPRYVNIRCPEIESHMFRDRVNETCHAGLGMVKLRGYGFRDQRYDFVSFPPRRFHMLGKLGKLSFRLERPDGSLYESHGVDHTLLLVLRYYSLPAAGGPSGPPTRSSLNPDYVPDIQKYLVSNRWAEEAEATERRDVRRYT